MTLGTSMTTLHKHLDAADAELLSLYCEAFNEPNNTTGISRLEALDAFIANLIADATETRGRIATLLEIRRGT
jgi:hypothetical protein